MWGLIWGPKFNICSIELGIRVASQAAKRLTIYCLMKLGNIRKTSNLGGQLDLCPVLLPASEIKQWQSKSI